MSALRATSMLRMARSAAVSRASVAATPLRSFSSLRTAPKSSTFVAAARQPVVAVAMQRRYASSGSLSHKEIQERIFDLLKSFEKVDPSAINAQAAFTTDLGLDSLDAVEVVMAIEEEFMIEIPDAEADNITSVQQAIDYISKTPSAT